MSYDEQPTRRVPVPPQEPRPSLTRPPAGPPPTDDPGDLERRVRAMQSWIVGLAVLTVVALGVAAWALLDGGGESSGGSASNGSGPTASLRERVDRVEDRLEARATDGDLTKLRTELETLEKQVTEAATSTTTSPAPTTTSPDGTDLGTLQTDVQDLQDRVSQLESGSGTGGGADPGTTVP